MAIYDVNIFTFEIILNILLTHFFFPSCLFSLRFCGLTPQWWDIGECLERVLDTGLSKYSDSIPLNTRYKTRNDITTPIRNAIHIGTGSSSIPNR